LEVAWARPGFSKWSEKTIMRALRCHEYGPAEALTIDEVPDPRPCEGEVVVDVKAASLNFPDVLMLQGKYQRQPEMPFVPGCEAAGIVSELGPGVRNISIGDRVIVLPPTGAFAEKVIGSAESLIRVPNGMSFSAASSIALTYGTSYHGLKQGAELRPGETLLVLGAAGGVGLAAVQLGKAMGATVIAAASTNEKLEAALASGADMTVDYAAKSLRNEVKALTGGRGIDVVYDPVGGDYAEAALRSLVPDGRFLVVGFAAGGIPKIPLNLILLKRCRVVGVFWGAWRKDNPSQSDDNYRKLMAMFDNKVLTPVVSEEFAFEDFAAAFRMLAERKAIGKVVIKMPAA
jgi:NADPH:quinone reductase